MSEDLVFHGLLTLHSHLKTLQPKYNTRDSQQEILEEKTIMLMRSLQDLPLSLSSRGSLLPFKSLLRFDEIGKELVKVHQVKEKSALEWGVLFAGVEELDEGRRVAEGEFEAYENMVARKKKSLTLYLEAYRAKRKPLF